MLNRIADAFEIRSRFLRATSLERDFGSPDALRGYVLTDTARDGLERMMQGLAPGSGHRAWRITGDYGTGKSTFALALAHLFAGEDRGLPTEFRSAVDFRTLGTKRPRLLPVLVTGSRVALAQRLLAAAEQSLTAECDRGKPPKILLKLRAATAPKVKVPVDDAGCVALLVEAAKYLRDSGRAAGLMIVLDEMGKFLEFAAQHPDRQDIFLLQTLAEAASRSADAPLFLVGILHQGFQAYAEQLSLAAQKEWEKVAGRFEEILFNQPLDQTTALVANALNVRRANLPKGIVAKLQDDMSRAIELGWYGPAAVRKSLLTVAPDLYPLHPSVVPVLVRLFGRFGQNERSLYSFLLSNEPGALQPFAQQAPRADLLYRIHDLYDYARTAFGHRLVLQSFRSHWNQIESVVESYPKDQELELRILKTVALLNLLDAPDLIATSDAVALAVADASPEAGRKVKSALKELQKGKSYVYYRGAAGGHCLWPYTSVNLERAHQDACKAVPISDSGLRLTATAAAITQCVSLRTNQLDSLCELSGEWFHEGGLLAKLHFVRERNQTVVKRKKAHVVAESGKLECEACRFDFFAFYGELGQGFAECHHIVPLTEGPFARETRLRDLAIVCANCHRMIHRAGCELSIAAIRDHLSNRHRGFTAVGSHAASDLS